MTEGATYVIIGGTGGIGRSIARRMVQRGARHIVLLSRRDNITTELKQLVQESRELGAFVYIKQCDASDEARVSGLVTDIGRMMPPIRGVIHAAMVLRVGTQFSIDPTHCCRLLTKLGCTIREDDVRGL